jgi:hypothetical protein
MRYILGLVIAALGVGILAAPAARSAPRPAPTHSAQAAPDGDDEPGEGVLVGIGAGRPLIIEGSPGGDVIAYRLKGLDLAYHHVPVILDGLCASACTLLVDLARADACITTEAIFALHQEEETRLDLRTGKKTTRYRPLVYETPGLNAYIERRGGLPRDDVMIMGFNELKAFYKPCPGADAAG